MADYSVLCPFCKIKVSLTPINQAHETGHFVYFMGRCPNTDKLQCEPVFVKYEKINDMIIEKYPLGNITASDFHEDIPETIRSDYAEGLRCLEVNACKGAVVLFRRVIEAIACDLLGEDSRRDNGQTKRLQTLINLMAERGEITRNIKDSAEAIKALGDYGAHVQDDGLDEIKKEDAEDVRTVAIQILSSVYLMPSKTRGLIEKFKGQTENSE